MSFYRSDPPEPGDFGSEEEYERAVRTWEAAEDEAAEEYIERMMEERHGQGD